MKAVFVIGLAVSSVAAVLLLFVVVPTLSVSYQEEEFEPVQEGPSPEEVPVFDEDYWSEDKEYWFPRNVPATGASHIVVGELVNKPLVEVYPEGGGKPALINQVKYSEAPWIHEAIDNNNQLVAMDDNSLAEFYAFYDKQDTFTPYFEVTFPDGSVKYYDVRLTEVP